MTSQYNYVTEHDMRRIEPCRKCLYNLIIKIYIKFYFFCFYNTNPIMTSQQSTTWDASSLASEPARERSTSPSSKPTRCKRRARRWRANRPPPILPPPTPSNPSNSCQATRGRSRVRGFLSSTSSKRFRPLVTREISRFSPLWVIILRIRVIIIKSCYLLFDISYFNKIVLLCASSCFFFVLIVYICFLWG